MPTHNDPPSGVASTLLGLTEGDEFWLRLGSGDDLIGTVLSTEQEVPGQHFETAGRYELEFEASGVRFRLSMQYREEEDGVPSTESLDFRLVEGHDWTIPITPEITRLDSR